MDTTRIVIEEQPPVSPSQCHYRRGWVYEVAEPDASWLLDWGFGYVAGELPPEDAEARFLALQARISADAEIVRTQLRRDRAARLRQRQEEQRVRVAAALAKKQAARDAAHKAAEVAQINEAIYSAAKASALRIARERKK